jgi:hypothetical protein
MEIRWRVERFRDGQYVHATEDGVHALCSADKRVDRMGQLRAGSDGWPVVSGTGRIICSLCRPIVVAKRSQ